MKRTVLFPLILTAAMVVLVAPHVFSQQNTTSVSKTTAAVQQATVSTQKTAASSKDRLAAPPTGPKDYDCAGGNCSCAGAKDCVDMKKICAPGTLGCNDYGCTCAEAEKPEGGDG